MTSDWRVAHRRSAAIGLGLILIWTTSCAGASAHDLLRQQVQSPSGQPNTCPMAAPAPPFPTAPQGYRRKYHTIAHRFLDSEAGAGDVTPQMYFVLDTMIADAVENLKPWPDHATLPERRAFAQNALNAIDCSLLRHRFVYPGHGLVQLLSDGLGPTLYGDPAALEELRSQHHNVRRARFIVGAGPYYVVDCDIASFIYLAVAEVMHYPIHLITIPTHNFVRWEIGDGATIDYETMDGMVTDDAYYITSWGIPERFAHKGGVLQSMTARQALAYHDSLVAVAWTWRDNIPKMIQFYQASIHLDPVPSFSYNNLGWYYAVGPILSARDGQKAIHYAEAAVRNFPDGDDLDTLACAYAEAGDFTTALTKEDLARGTYYVPFGSAIDADSQRMAAHQACTDPEFGKDPTPFRPAPHR